MNSKEILEDALHKINWSLKDYGCEHYLLIDHKGNPSKYVLWGNKISIDSNEGEALESSVFYITKKSVHYEPDTMRNNRYGFVSVGTKRAFVIFMNHDKKEDEG
jgi:hypothetical protein